MTMIVNMVDCNEQQHSKAILDIFNETIANSTALYEYEPKTERMIEDWFSQKRDLGFPIIGVVDNSGQLLGFASWSTFRNFPAYKFTVEHSIYVRSDSRGQGIGRLLLVELIKRALSGNVHMLVACIDATNKPSIRLHMALGFKHAGTLKEVGCKFEQWLDVSFYQLRLGAKFIDNVPADSLQAIST